MFCVLVGHTFDTSFVEINFFAWKGIKHSILDIKSSIKDDVISRIFILRQKVNCFQRKLSLDDP